MGKLIRKLFTKRKRAEERFGLLVKSLDELHENMRKILEKLSKLEDKVTAVKLEPTVTPAQIIREWRDGDD